jgi:hypothetical protein
MGMPTPLAAFIASNRAEILKRCSAKYVSAGETPTRLPRERGIPLFLDQIVHELRGTKPDTDMMTSALQHGRDLFADGFTVKQLVHDYGGVCQSITDLAAETAATITVDEFRTLNRCLDDAVAHAADEFSNQERSAGDIDNLRVRDLVSAIVDAFDTLRLGKVGVTGSTSEFIQRSLSSLKVLVDRDPR